MTDQKPERAGGAASAVTAGEAQLSGPFDRILGAACAVILGLIAGVLSLQVVMRYVVANPLIWADEASRLLMVWLTFTGATLAYRTKSHIAITLLADTVLADRRDGTAARALRVVVDGVVLIAASALLIGGVVILARTSGHTTPALQLPVAVLFLPAPLSGAVILGSAAQQIITRISARSKGGRP